MSTIPKKLIDYWRGQGLSLMAGCDAQAIAEFERRHHIEIPQTMREYYLSTDGMAETFKDAQDKNGFSFWCLARVSRVRDIPDGVPIPPFSGDMNLFVFADYMQWSWAYAADFSPGSAGAVILVGKESPEQVATSFEEFVDLYVSDSDRLYAGPSFTG
jgi:SMI1 / KNR4 family (SUKH-1)